MHILGKERDKSSYLGNLLCETLGKFVQNLQILIWGDYDILPHEI